MITSFVTRVAFGLIAITVQDRTRNGKEIEVRLTKLGKDLNDNTIVAKNFPFSELTYCSYYSLSHERWTILANASASICSSSMRLRIHYQFVYPTFGITDVFNISIIYQGEISWELPFWFSKRCAEYFHLRASVDSLDLWPHLSSWRKCWL